MSQILIFGDSITYGASDLAGGWVSRLRKYIDIKSENDPNYYYLVYNLGVSGQNSTDILKRFESEAQPRIKEEGETIFIFALGTNDSQLFAGKFRTEPEQFKMNLEQLTELAKKYSSKIVFVDLFPIDETKTSPVPWHAEKFYKNENIAINNNIIKEFCQQNKLLFINIYDHFSKTEYLKLLDDGLHPNIEGHKQMYELIKEVLIKNNII
ncbi:MAG: GDSL-type esterase/lipase family protein [Candidatus Parcubacteria bacterium]|nr:GDSL-type esterase/lipase family protein [Candidatus Parcubacteria bacterium]